MQLTKCKRRKKEAITSKTKSLLRKEGENNNHSSTEIGELAINSALREEIKEITRKADSSDIPTIRVIAEQCIHLLEEEGIKNLPIVTEILLECAGYYEQIGWHQEAHALCLDALKYSETAKDIALQRRAHNNLSYTYSRLCDFSKACIHMELAYGFALEINNPIFILAASANTVALLHQMGLLDNARELALRVSKKSCINRTTASLHLMNANNGMKICHLLKDMKTAEEFYQLAAVKFSKAEKIVSKISKAHFYSASANHLTLSGSPTEALKLIESSVESFDLQSNIRIRALIYCAEAEASVALQDFERVREYQKKLDRLVKETQFLPVHHEDVLRTLIKLYDNQPKSEAASSRTKAFKYFKLLREHLVAVKHKCFFADAHISGEATTEGYMSLEDPAYVVPDWIKNIRIKNDAQARRGSKNGSESTSIARKTPFDIIELSIIDQTDILRTDQFKTAENWAVAAEFLSGGTGRHCFQVGRLASEIAAELGWPEKECHILGLACRLHDIGKVTISPNEVGPRSERAFGRFSSFCEHALAGKELLARNMDKTFQLASSVAMSHHEWWNGCGYPNGLSRAAIPIEARICAIADTFVALVDPAKGKQSWSVEDAVLQIQTMAGVQLDPDLVMPLTRAVARNNEAYGMSENISSELEDNQLIRAKRRLCEALQLSD